MNYRKANFKDVEQLIELRKVQLIDEGIEPTQNIDVELRDFFQNKLQDGSLLQWVVEEQDEIIASGAIQFFEFPPSYNNKSGKKGYITNMYTKESYRGQGIATALLRRVVEGAKHAGVTKLWLGASKLGKPVYKKFGFKEAEEYMELNLD